MCPPQDSAFPRGHRFVVKLGRAVAPARVAPAVGAHGLAVLALAARDQGERRLLAWARGILQQRAQALAGQRVRRLHAAVVGHGRIEVHQFDQALAHAARLRARRGDDQRHAATALEERVLVPPVPLVVVIAVVAGEDDHRRCPTA